MEGERRTQARWELPEEADTSVDGPPATPVQRPTGSGNSHSGKTRERIPEPVLTTDGSMVLIDRDHFFERQDHVASAARLRRLLPLAMVLWMGFFIVDFVLATWVVAGDLWPYLALRAIGLVPMVFAWWRLRTGLPSPAELQLLDITMTTSCAALLTGMCLLSGGLVSPYNSYIPLVLVGRAAVLPNHWKEGALRLGLPALINPLVLGAGALLSEAVAQQFATPSARGTFFFYLMLIGGAWLLLVIGGHNVWSLRRQVFRSRSIGRYRLETRIGRGGMGEVWVAFHDQLKRRVALKILRPDAGTDPIAVERFNREIMATAALTHPNTIRIYDHGVTEDGLWYYAMEYLAGRDLGSLVREQGPLLPSRAIYLLHQAARALAEAHERSIVHRDLKPENLFITTLGGEPDFVKVLDFGIVQVEDPDARLTSTGFVAGTPAYVAPEVAEGGQAGPTADVYGLGGTLYYALTGTMPFQATNARAMFHAHSQEPLQRPSERLGRPLPADLEEVVVRAMAKAPADRYPDAGALATALAACADAGRWSATEATSRADARADTELVSAQARP